MGQLPKGGGLVNLFIYYYLYQKEFSLHAYYQSKLFFSFCDEEHMGTMNSYKSSEEDFFEGISAEKKIF